MKCLRRWTDLSARVRSKLGTIGVAMAAFAVAVAVQLFVTYWAFALLVATVARVDAGLAEGLAANFWPFAAAGYLGWAAVAVAVIRAVELEVDVGSPDARELSWTVGGFLFAVGTALAANRLAGVLGYELTRSGTPDHAPLVAVGSAAVLLLAAAVEEFLFRGAIQGVLRRDLSPPAAILGTSLLFVPVHLPGSFGPSAAATAINLVVLFVHSTVLGYLYERHRNLAVPVLVHGGYNAVVAWTAYGPSVPLQL